MDSGPEFSGSAFCHVAPLSFAPSILAKRGAKAKREAQLTEIPEDTPCFPRNAFSLGLMSRRRGRPIRRRRMRSPHFPSSPVVARKRDPHNAARPAGILPPGAQAPLAMMAPGTSTSTCARRASFTHHHNLTSLTEYRAFAHSSLGCRAGGGGNGCHYGEEWQRQQEIQPERADFTVKDGAGKRRRPLGRLCNEPCA